jgi:hypothetical protein
MATPALSANTAPRNIGRSVVAVLAGIVLGAALSLGTDEILHLLKVYPPWGQPMPAPGENALALSYRIVYTVLSGYLTAALAPRNPLRHAVILGLIGLVICTLAVIATLPLHLGPSWYPIILAVTALPCMWLGGILYGGKS